MDSVFRGRVIEYGAIGEGIDVVNDKGEYLTDVLEKYMGKNVEIVILSNEE